MENGRRKGRWENLFKAPKAQPITRHLLMNFQPTYSNNKKINKKFTEKSVFIGKKHNSQLKNKNEI
jgi:hypothetical protein